MQRHQIHSVAGWIQDFWHRRILPGLVLGNWLRVMASSPGSLDPTFDPGSGFNGSVLDVAIWDDGTILACGSFTAINGITRPRIARLDALGKPVMDFDPRAGANGTILDLALTMDGKILIGGAFTQFDQIPRQGLARLLDNGRLDTDFDPGSGVSGTASPAVYSVAALADGRVLFGGMFTNVNGLNRNYVGHLSPAGQPDLTFQPVLPLEEGDGVLNVAVPTNGMALIGGQFRTVNGQPRIGLARLTATGALDKSFDAKIEEPCAVFDLALQSDGKILVGGYFIRIAGTLRQAVARLHPDGSLDTSFDPGLGANDQINALALQPDGKVLIGGYFTTFNHVTCRHIARLNPNGSLDTDFQAGVEADPDGDAAVLALALQNDGRILVGGRFNTVNGQSRNRLARLHSGLVIPATPPRLEPVGLRPDTGFRLQLIGDAGQSYTVQTSTNLQSWQTWTNFLSARTETDLFDHEFPGAARRFYRALSP